MGEIPEDVVEKARVALMAALTAARHKTADEAIGIIAQAILAERNRCAAVALSKKGRSGVDPEYDAACDDIEDDIMNGVAS